MSIISPGLFTPMTGPGTYYGLGPGDLAPGTYSVNSANEAGLPVACPIAPGANAAIITAKSILRFWFSPDAALAGELPMEVSPGTIMGITVSQLWSLCFEVDASTSFTLQYCTGEGGVAPFFFLSDSGGIIPPPPPGLSAVRTPRVLHVMPAPVGNDATGTPYRQDLPYATIAAAEGAATPGDTILIWAGSYTAVNLGTVDRVAYELLGATITDDGSDQPLFTLISGQSIEIRGTGVLMQNSSNVACLFVNRSTLICSVRVESNAQALVCSRTPYVQLADTICSGGISVLNESKLVLKGTLTNNAGTAIQSSNSEVYLYGNLMSNQQGIDAKLSKVLVHGNIECLGMLAVSCTFNASVNVYGNIKVGSSAIGDAVYIEDSIAMVYGNIDHAGSGPAVNIFSGMLLVYGDVRQTGALGFGIACVSGGYEVWGNVYSASAFAARANGPGASGIVHGRCQSDAGAAVEAVAGSITMYGLCLSTTGAAADVGIGGTIILRGSAYLQGTGSESITGSGTLRSYGAYANRPAAITVTVAGTLNILP